MGSIYNFSLIRIQTYPIFLFSIGFSNLKGFMQKNLFLRPRFSNLSGHQAELFLYRPFHLHKRGVFRCFWAPGQNSFPIDPLKSLYNSNFQILWDTWQAFFCINPATQDICKFLLPSGIFFNAFFL